MTAQIFDLQTKYRTEQPTDCSRYDSITKKAWDEHGLIVIHRQDDRMDEELRGQIKDVVTKIARRIKEHG